MFKYIDNFKTQIKDFSNFKFLLYLFIIGYIPIIIFGFFIQDDFGILNLSKHSIIDAAKHMCSVNNNRPISCLYFGLLTRLFPVYQIYFLFIIFIYSLFIFFINRTFSFLFIDNIVTKIFNLFLIFPFFSYTIFYSPGMQGIGSLSLLFWSLSLYFLKKNIVDRKYIYLIISYTFILLMFLLYESAAPLLGISLFFPLLFKKKIRIFIFNFIVIFLIMISIFYLQKYVFPKFFSIDLSRIKVSLFDIKKILYLIIINLALTINIIFHSLEIFFYNIVHTIKNFNLILISQIFILVFFVIITLRQKTIKEITKFTLQKNQFILSSILMIMTVIFLNSLMHSLANTGLEFIKYNNRALVSISFLLPFISLILFNIIDEKKRGILINSNLIVFVILISNFLFFQNNMIHERFEAKRYVKSVQENLDDMGLEINTEKRNIIFVLEDLPKIKRLLSYNSYDGFDLYINNIGIHSPKYKYVNKLKFCNKNYYNEYLKIAYLDRPKLYNFSILYNQELKTNLKNEYVESYFLNHFQCSTVNDSENVYISKTLNKNVYIDERYDSIFLTILKKINNFIFK